jgi:hypothetical protein
MTLKGSKNFKKQDIGNRQSLCLLYFFCKIYNMTINDYFIGSKDFIIPGLNPTISKNREKSCFLYIQEIFNSQIFSVKQKKNLHRFFGAASWQEFCNLFL